MRKQLLPTLVVFAMLSAHASAGSSTSSNQHFVPASKTGQWKASKLIGLKIYNSKNENIGQIAELLLDHAGSVEAVVISVGGFLGVGQRDIAVPYKAIRSPNQVDTASGKGTEGKKEEPPKKSSGNTPDGAIGTPAFGVLDLTADEIKSAPQFKYVQ